MVKQKKRQQQRTADIRERCLRPKTPCIKYVYYNNMNANKRHKRTSIAYAPVECNLGNTLYYTLDLWSCDGATMCRRFLTAGELVEPHWIWNIKPQICKATHNTPDSTEQQSQQQKAIACAQFARTSAKLCGRPTRPSELAGRLSGSHHNHPNALQLTHKHSAWHACNNRRVRNNKHKHALMNMKFVFIC